MVRVSDPGAGSTEDERRNDGDRGGDAGFQSEENRPSQVDRDADTDTSGAGTTGDGGQRTGESPTERNVRQLERQAQQFETGRTVSPVERNVRQLTRQGRQAGGTGIDRAPEGTQRAVEQAPGPGQVQEQAIERQVEAQIGRQNLQQTPAGTRRAIGLEPGTVSDEQARQFADVQRGRDFTIQRDGQQVDVQFTEEFFEQQLTEQLDIAAEAGEDFTIEETPEGGQRVSVTEQGRQEAITSELLSRGEIETERESVTIPPQLTFGAEITLGGGTRTTEIERASQLEFDEQGNLVDVSAPETTAAEERAAQQRLSEALGGGFQAQAVSAGAFASRDFLQGAGDVAADAGEVYGQEVSGPVSEVFTDIGGAVSRGAQAAAFTTTEAQFGTDLSEEREAAVSGAQEQFQDIYRGESAEALAATAPAESEAFQTDVEDVAEDTAVGEQVGEFTGGVASLPRLAIELPETAATGAEVGGEALAFTVEEPTAAPGAAVGTAVNVGETIAVQTAQNPARVSGQLVGSGAVFKAARGVGPRTSLGTRLAIQPGEEILGYGGAGFFRRLPGERTTRVGERLFPDNEPLIFSEEAAIRGARRAGGAARRGGARVRSEVSARTPDLRGPRVGRGLASEIQEFRSDIRGQADLTLEMEGERETALEEPSLSAELQQELERMERAELTRRAEARGRQRGQERQQELREAAEAPDVGFDPTPSYEVRAVSRPEVRTADPQPGALSRSGPTPAQQRAFRSSITSTEVEAEADLLEEAQEPQVTAEATEPPGTIEDTRIDTEAAREEFTGLQLRQRREVALDVDELAVSELLAEPIVDTRPVQRGALEIRTETDTELRQELRPELEAEQEQEAETESELESELETEPETEQETELEGDFELEPEPELETELEIETETEQEVETELFDEDDEDDFLEEFDSGDFERVFQYDVADPGELLEGDVL